MKAKLACAVIASWLAVSNAIGAAAQKAYPFFPFCIDWHDAKQRSFEQQAEMLKELGYDGVGHHLARQGRRAAQDARRRRPEAVSDHHDRRRLAGQAALRSAVQGSSGAGQRPQRAVSC